MSFDSEFYFFDAHSHLQEPEILWDIDGIMARWQQNFGRTIVCCGTKESDWDAVAGIAARFDYVIPCFGIHPWFVDNVSEKWFDILDIYLDKEFHNIKSVNKSNALVFNQTDSRTADQSAINSRTANQNINDICLIKPFIGEIGLDYAVKNIDKTKQENIFKTQICMAKERKIPVSIHIRKGWDSLFKILKYVDPLPAKGMIHSYSGPADLIPILEKYGLYISFSGSVTNPKNKKVQKSLKAVSLDKLLIETDSPAILPFYSQDSIQHLLMQHFNEYEQFKGKDFVQSEKLYDMGWNEPCNIFIAACAVSQVLGITISEIAKITASNGEKLFF